MQSVGCRVAVNLRVMSEDWYYSDDMWDAYYRRCEREMETQNGTRGIPYNYLDGAMGTYTDREKLPRARLSSPALGIFQKSFPVITSKFPGNFLEISVFLPTVIIDNARSAPLILHDVRCYEA